MHEAAKEQAPAEPQPTPPDDLSQGERADALEQVQDKGLKQDARVNPHFQNKQAMREASATRAVIGGISFLIGLVLTIWPLYRALYGLQEVVDVAKKNEVTSFLPWLLGAKAVIVASAIGAGAGLISFSGKMLRPLWMDLRLAELKAESKDAADEAPKGANGTFAGAIELLKQLKEIAGTKGK